MTTALEEALRTMREVRELAFVLGDEIYVWRVRALTLAEVEMRREGRGIGPTLSGYHSTVALVSLPEGALPEMTPAEIVHFRNCVDAIAVTFEPEPARWNIDPNSGAAWCPSCKGPMTERGCFRGAACRPDQGEHHAFEIALAPGGPK